MPEFTEDEKVAVTVHDPLESAMSYAMAALLTVL
jgi:hypothetical protein